MYTRTCLGTQAHMPTRTHADTRGLDPEGTHLGEVGLQGSSGHMLAPGLCVALPPQPGSPARSAQGGVPFPGAGVHWGSCLKLQSPQEAFSSTFKIKFLLHCPAALNGAPRREAFSPKREMFLKREKSSKDSPPSDISVCCLSFLNEIFVLYFPSHCCVLVC